MNVGVLIYFIHHTAEAIQVNNVIRHISDDLLKTINKLYPERHDEIDEEKSGASKNKPQPPPAFEKHSATLLASGNGYVQTLDPDGLVELAREKDLIIRLLRRPGHFLVSGTPLADVFPAESVDDNIAASINDQFVCGSKRPQEYDLEFLVNELVEIAVRALSPGVNDPFTAINCIDHLCLALCDLVKRAVPPDECYDSEGSLRVILYQTTFAKILDVAFNQIRQNSRRNAAVTIRLMECLKTIIGFTWNAEQKQAIFRQAIMIERVSRKGLFETMDIGDVSIQFESILRKMRKQLPSSVSDKVWTP